MGTQNDDRSGGFAEAQGIWSDASGVRAFLRAALAEKGWSQAQLSERAGLGRGAVNDILTHPERRPREATLEALEHALEIERGTLARIGSGAAAVSLTPLDAGEVGALTPSAAFSGIAAMVSDEPTRWVAFGERVGGQVTRLVLADCARPAETGALVVAQTQGGTRVCYHIQPYLVWQDLGTFSNAILGMAGTYVIGCVSFDLRR